MSPAQADYRRAPDMDPADHAYYTDCVKIPGFGFQPERCRLLRPIGFCTEGHPVLGANSCAVRSCPEHFRDWIERAATNAVARLAAYRCSRDGWDRRMVHAVFSPDQSRRWSVRAFYEARSESYDVAREVGVRGGATVAHPYRTSEALDSMWREAVEAGAADPRRGIWLFGRELADGSWEAMKEAIEPAPHYHMLAAVQDFDGEAVPEGWIGKNIRSMSRFHIDDPEAYADMASTVYYLLSHAADGRNEAGNARASLTYFGEIHPNSFNPEEELTAAEWTKIQRMAADAVGTDPELPGHGMTCPCEDCEAEVLQLSELSDWMDDEDWFANLPPRRRNMLRALEAWAVLQVDRPPPRAVCDREALDSWLVERGQLLTDADRTPMGAEAERKALREFGAAAY